MERELERRLVARLKAGDVAAFEAVYETYRPRLFSFLARLSRRRDVAEDLLDETWLRLISCSSRLSFDTCLAAWLFTVARNLHSSWRRHRALDEDRVVDAPATWPDPAPGESPFDAAARDETERRLERALASLPLCDREVLLMMGVGGVGAEDAARALGLSSAALRKRLQRARERLAVAMEPDEALAVKRRAEALRYPESGKAQAVKRRPEALRYPRESGIRRGQDNDAQGP